VHQQITYTLIYSGSCLKKGMTYGNSAAVARPVGRGDLKNDRWYDGRLAPSQVNVNQVRQARMQCAFVQNGRSGRSRKIDVQEAVSCIASRPSSVKTSRAALLPSWSIELGKIRSVRSKRERIRSY